MSLKTCVPRSITIGKKGFARKLWMLCFPRERPARERWLTRSEAARLLLAAWRYREVQKGKPTDRRSRQHVAKFILVALYSGTRASAVCGAAFGPTIGRGWIDLDRGVFYRRPAGFERRKSASRRFRCPPSCSVICGAGSAADQRFAVEWNREPVKGIKKAFARAVKDAGLGCDVTPHVLRHTAATWLMQAGVDPWEAAGYLGMTIEMLSQRYGHHHPAHLERARNAFGTHPPHQTPHLGANRSRTNVVERDENC